jgi:DNA-binding MarR family transcriptional regulator
VPALQIFDMLTKANKICGFLSVRELLILLTIDTYKTRHPDSTTPPSILDLAADVTMARPIVSRWASDLYERGLITIYYSETDKRLREVEMTEVGRKLVGELLSV